MQHTYIWNHTHTHITDQEEEITHTHTNTNTNTHPHTLHSKETGVHKCVVTTERTNKQLLSSKSIDWIRMKEMSNEYEEQEGRWRRSSSSCSSSSGKQSEMMMMKKKRAWQRCWWEEASVHGERERERASSGLEEILSLSFAVYYFFCGFWSFFDVFGVWCFFFG